MTYDEFEEWLIRLGPKDLDYLQKHKVWMKEYRAMKKSGLLPKGFPEQTMEILEDGSDSET
jgi:hypothetical protein